MKHFDEQLTMETGFYWAYTLDHKGDPLELLDEPTIVYYSAERNGIQQIGYDMELEYNSSSCQLIRKLVFQG